MMKAALRRLSTLPNAWIVFVIFFSSRAIYALVWLLVSIRSDSSPNLSAFCQYDCNWYLTIINDGYMDEPLTSGHVGAANWAFFPLFPILIRIAHSLTDMNPILIGIILNNLFYYAFIVLVLKYHRQKFPNVNQTHLTYVLSFSPIGIYVNSLYTESLYILLLILILLCIEKKYWFAIGLLGVALSSTRFTGVFMVLLVLVKLFEERERIRTNFSQKLLSILLFPFGLISFMIYLRFKTGDFLAFKSIQKAWGFGDLDFFVWFKSVLHSSSITQWGYLVTLFSALLLTVYFFKLKNYQESIILFVPFLISILSVAINYRYFYSLYPYATFIAILMTRFNFIRLTALLAAPIGYIALEVAWLQGAGFLV